MIPPIFAGQPAIIIAGGPSLVGFDWRQLKGLNTIAVNRAYEVVPDAKMLWWTDAAFFRWHREALLAHAAPVKATVDLCYLPGEIPPEVHAYRQTGARGFDPTPGCVRHGNNATYAAMHVAAGDCQAAALILLGVDMKYSADRRSHWHKGHGVEHFEKCFASVMLPFFPFLVSPLAERNVQVVNASPDSALRLWPRCTIQEGLARYGELSIPHRHF